MGDDNLSPVDPYTQQVSNDVGAETKVVSTTSSSSADPRLHSLDSSTSGPNLNSLGHSSRGRSHDFQRSWTRDSGGLLPTLDTFLRQPTNSTLQQDSVREVLREFA